MTPIQLLNPRMLGIVLFLVSSVVGAGEEGDSAKYTCPMHPHYIADEMGSCPICGMDLVKMTSGPELALEEEDTDGERAAITIAPETIQNMGVRYAQPEATVFGRRIRAYGVVAENERLRSEISSRVAGWIESLAVTAVGDKVKRGNLLYRLFSPDLVAAQQDYLSALERQSANRIQSAAIRLGALGVSKSFIATLRKKRSVVEQVPFYASADGTLSDLRVREGTYVRPGETLAVIQDYSTVWINAAVAEKDLVAINSTTQVRIMLPNLPGQVIETSVDYIHPTVDRSSRTGTVRLQLDNKDNRLRPGAYADVLFEVGLDRRLAVPDSALLIGADGPYLVVALGNGRFQPRQVRTGLSSGGFTEVVEGIDRDERIVASGQFLIDSESALRESFQKLQRLKLELADLNLSKAQMAMVDHLVDAGLYLHEALADGYDVDPVQLQPALEIRDLLWPKFGNTRLGPVLDNANHAIAEAQQARTESDLRNALHGLVSALRPWMLDGRKDYYHEKGVRLFKDVTDGRLWVQQGDQVFSPYLDGSKGALVQ
ncbi:MAG: efflux RND transporter periplasmic adaptor subunit [gamma proteobacterium symbiont of Ctena orbiculata]|nr:MAG: efflux RND transporter periplasmic adaptor subunit [gamma proteobacterium symbiont of Ctena orbiculata]